jgi:hypothetical protein
MTKFNNQGVVSGVSGRIRQPSELRQHSTSGVVDNSLLALLRTAVRLTRSFATCYDVVFRLSSSLVQTRQ